MTAQVHKLRGVIVKGDGGARPRSTSGCSGYDSINSLMSQHEDDRGGFPGVLKGAGASEPLLEGSICIWKENWGLAFVIALSAFEKEARWRSSRC
jgi:hypothetical protein